MTPFETLYGYAPPIHSPYIVGSTNTAEVNSFFKDRDAMLRLLRFHLHRAQHRMLQFANKKRSDRTFQIGEWVYVKLKAYKQQSLARRPNKKLSLYYDPYLIIDKIGEVAYKLDLPHQSVIYPTFHVSKLQKSVKDGIGTSYTLPGSVNEEPIPECILERKMVKWGNRATTKVLVQ